MSCISIEQGYDPFKPEVVRPEEQQNGKPAASGDISGALELVNKAIEEVRSEVEREKRKLSRIGDEPYDPSESTSLSSSDAAKSKTPGSHPAYDPGSYQMTSGGYNPTPGCSKYTLDSDTQESKSNSMEYVPTSLKKPSTRTHTHQLPSPPPSPKYSNSTSFSKSKYIVDNSRPSTDMEYDPLSNYSAGIAVKSKRESSAQAIKTDGSKTHKSTVSGFSEEDYVVAVKKPQQQSVDTKKYTISDSDEESSGTEYRPTSLSNLQQRKGATGSVGDIIGKERKERTEKILNALTQRNKEDLTQLTDVHDISKRKENLEKKKVSSQTSHEKSGKSEKIHKLEKGLNKTCGGKSSSSSSKDKSSVKSTSQYSAKKENKSHEKSDDKKNTVKIKISDKVYKDEKRSDGKIKAVEKVNASSSNKDKNTENCARESNKSNTSDKEKEHKYKDSQHKNGKFDSSKRGKDAKKISKSSSSSSRSSHSNSKMSSANSKDKVKPKINSSKDKQQSLSLSHADLFGDESPDEVEPMEVDNDDDDEVEEVLVRKSADALKRGRLNKRKASELTPSSSDNEGDRGVDGIGAGRDKANDVGFDFSSFQDDLDFDSDPMEECLRIFNESKDVKREDKGRQIKQVLVFCSCICCFFHTVFLIRFIFCYWQNFL